MATVTAGTGDPGIARKGARTLVFRIATAISDTLVVVVTARGLGAEGRGLYALASFTAAVVASMVGGTATAISADYAHERAGIARLVAGSVLVSLVGGTVVGLGLAVAAAVTWPDAKVLVYPALIAPLLILGVLQIQLYQALGDIRRMSWVMLATSVVPLVALALAVVVAPGRAYVALGCWAAARAIVPLATLAWQRRQTRFEFRGLRAMLRRLFRRGMPISVANGIQLLNYRVDLIVVTALLPLAAVGRYSVAVAVGESLLILSRSVGIGAFQRLITSGRDESIGLLVRVIRHGLGLLVLGGVALVVAAWLLLGPVLGGEFDGVWLPLALLMPGIVALGTSESLRVHFLVRLERSREYLVAATASMVINLALAVALVPPLGLSGAALSTSISYLLGGLYLFVRFAHEGGPRGIGPYVPRPADFADYGRLILSLRRDRRRRPGRAPLGAREP